MKGLMSGLAQFLQLMALAYLIYALFIENAPLFTLSFVGLLVFTMIKSAIDEKDEE